jgi:phosphoglycerate dehydrogenase-like enzyme
MHLLIVDQLAQDFKKALEPKFPELSIDTVIKTEDIGDFIEKAEMLLIMGPPAIKISDEMMKKASKLQWIQSIISGVDFLINLPSLRKEVIITSTRGIHGPQVSELAFLLMLALNRNFPQIVKNQGRKVWERWVPNFPNCAIEARLLYQKKVGIMGLGAIGEDIARKCKAFGMMVFGIARTKKLAHTVDYYYPPEKLLEVIKEVDYFINVVPSTPQTHKMIGAKEISHMKPTAFFINVGRGDTVDEEVLIDALKTGKIAGAGLDCFYTEPLPKNNPLWGMKNVIVTPHIGGQSDIYVQQVLPIFEENLRRFLQGERRDLINFVER